MNQWERLSRSFFRCDSCRRLLGILPSVLMLELQQQFNLDCHARKLPFMRFVRFMVLALLICGNHVSLRRLARKTRHKTIRQLTGLNTLSHTTIAK